VQTSTSICMNVNGEEKAQRLAYTDTEAQIWYQECAGPLCLLVQGKFEMALGSESNGPVSRPRVGTQFRLGGWGSEGIKSVSITVGKNSLLTVQTKIYEKDSDDYELVLFDYEGAGKPREFFEPLMALSANARAEVLLDGKEVILDIEGAPGLKQAMVRLHGKYDGPSCETPGIIGTARTPGPTM